MYFHSPAFRSRNVDELKDYASRSDRFGKFVRRDRRRVDFTTRKILRIRRDSRITSRI